MKAKPLTQCKTTKDVISSMREMVAELNKITGVKATMKVEKKRGLK
jgi:hypothetical protein